MIVNVLTEDGTTVNVVQSSTPNVIEVVTAGPQGPQGPPGSGGGGSIDTGSLLTTASFNSYTGSNTSQFAGTSSYALTASFALNGGGNINTGSFVTTSSFNSFTSSYNSGSFTGSFSGNFSGTFSGSGANLSNIPASGIIGLNLSQITSGSVSASISPNNGLQVNTNVTATSFTGSLQGTASYSITSSYSDNAQTASYVLQAVSSSYALTASYVNPLRQDVLITGSLNVSGSTVQVGNTTLQGNTILSGSIGIVGTSTLTGSLLISGSTTQIGTNNLLGQTNLSGSIIVSGTMQANANVTIGGTLRLDPSQDPGGNNLTASFLFTSASNTAQGYDLYYRQSGNLAKFKWLEGGISTGLLYGGVVSASGTTIYVSSGSGLVMTANASLSQEINPQFKYITWNAYSASATYLTSSQHTFLYVDDTGVVRQQPNYFVETQYQEAICLGRATHANYTTITGVGSNVQTTYDSDAQQNDFIRAFGPLKTNGLTVTGQATTLRLNIGAGQSYNLGGFYPQNPDHPSDYTSNAFLTASIARAYRTGSAIYLDNNAGTFYTVIDPTKYDDGSGVLQNTGTGNWTIQRVFVNPVSGRVVVYYGQTRYTTQINALQYLNTDPFNEGEFTAKSLIFAGYLVLKGNTTDLTDPENNIIQSGIFRNTAGGSASSGTVSLALDNLSDVNITTPTDGQAVVYNSGVFVNGTPLNATSASRAVSSSFASTASFVSPLNQNVTISGSARITGSLNIIGPAVITGSLNMIGSAVITGSLSQGEGTALGIFSHAEGYNTVTLEEHSHAEGSETTASGVASHAEGHNTVTLGGYSHAEGLGTITLGSYQHVQGQYNISSSAQSAFIHGNGTSNVSRSNLIFASGSEVQITGSLIQGTAGNIASGLGSHAEGGYVSSLGTSMNISTVTSMVMNDAYLQFVNLATTTTIEVDDDKTSLFPPAPFTITSLILTSGSTSITANISQYASAIVSSYNYDENVGSNGTTYFNFTTNPLQQIYYNLINSPNKALGTGSHAEGLGTIAKGDFQHVQGQYNITSSIQSAFIHGNGTSDTARSNLIFTSGSQVQITGSLNISGSLLVNGVAPGGAAFPFSGSAVITGSLLVSGSTRITGSLLVSGSTTITGSLIATQGITGSLFGTSSFALSSSFATSASNALTASSAITQTAGDNSNKIATTAFVSTALSVGGVTVSGQDTFGTANIATVTAAQYAAFVTASTVSATTLYFITA